MAADPQDGRNLIITVGSKAGSQFVKQTNASIRIEAADSGITHILTADSGKPADLRYIGTIIPSGLALDTVSSTAGGMQDGTVTAGGIRDKAGDPQSQCPQHGLHPPAEKRRTRSAGKQL